MTLTEFFVDDARLLGVDEDLHEGIRRKIEYRSDRIQEFLVGKDVLDLGCGSGFSTNRYAKVVKSIIGVDIDPNAITFAQNNYAGISFINYDARRVDELFKPESFDVVVCTEMLEHISAEDAELVLGKVHGLLRDGGLFIGSVPFENDVGNSRWHKTFYSKDGLVSLLDKFFKDLWMGKLDHPHTKYFFGSSWVFRGAKK